VRNFGGNFGLFKGYLINLLGLVLGKQPAGGAVKSRFSSRQESALGCIVKGILSVKASFHPY
jgi:hypothetical protein